MEVDRPLSPNLPALLKQEISKTDLFSEEFRWNVHLDQDELLDCVEKSGEEMNPVCVVDTYLVFVSTSGNFYALERNTLFLVGGTVDECIAFLRERAGPLAQWELEHSTEEDSRFEGRLPTVEQLYDALGIPLPIHHTKEYRSFLQEKWRETALSKTETDANPSGVRNRPCRPSIAVASGVDSSKIRSNWHNANFDGYGY